jgi:type IV secretion system protein VirB3
MALRALPFRRIGNRVIGFMGGDREMMMVLALLCGVLIFSGMTKLTTVMGLTLWFGGMKLLRMMWKADPELRKIYLKARGYRKYYPARSTHWRTNKTKTG